MGVRPIPALKEVVPTQRIAPVAHRTPTLAGGPTGDGSRRKSRGASPPEKLQKKGGALGALAAGVPGRWPSKRGVLMYSREELDQIEAEWAFRVHGRTGFLGVKDFKALKSCHALGVSADQVIASLQLETATENLAEIAEALAHTIETRADQLTRRWTAWPSFEAMLTPTDATYFPTLEGPPGRSRAAKQEREELAELADLYDRAQAARGDARRAFRRGSS